MGDLTKNLSRAEFACTCGCELDSIDPRLPDLLQDVVNHFQEKNPDKIVKININSGCRCKKRNAAVGGSPRSQHTPNQGCKASDFYLYDSVTYTKLSENAVADYLEKKYPNTFGIGRYDGRTHLDTRDQKARWDKRS